VRPTVGDDQIRLPIVIEVARGERDRTFAHANLLSILKCAIGSTQQNGHGAGSEIARRQVNDVVIVEFARH
jgi:hypothetical protein